MEKLKKILISISVLLGVTTYLYYMSTKDFRWSEKIYKRNPTGIIVSESTQGISLLNPWTWRKQPVRKISMMNKYCYGIYNGFYYAHIVTFTIDEKTSSRIFVIDTMNHNFTSKIIDSRDTIPLITENYFQNLDWRPMSRANWEYFEKIIPYINPHHIGDAFGFYYDIKEDLKSGKYRVNYSEGKKILDLINMEPYYFVEADYELIYKEFNNWAKENGYDQEILANQQTVKYNSTIYSSQLVDIYVISLNDYEKKYFIFSDSNTDNTNTSKKIKILHNTEADIF